MDKRTRKKHDNQRTSSVTSDTVSLILPEAKGCTGYTIYNIAPIPVRIGLGECVRIEPITDGYNIYEVQE